MIWKQKDKCCCCQTYNCIWLNGKTIKSAIYWTKYNIKAYVWFLLFKFKFVRNRIPVLHWHHYLKHRYGIQYD